MNMEITTDSIPFKWKGSEYRITHIGLRSPTDPFAIVEPEDSELVEELKRRLIKDQGFIIYRGKGFKCFPEEVGRN